MADLQEVNQTLKEQNELPPNPSQGFLGTVEDNRQKFEDLFKNS